MKTRWYFWECVIILRKAAISLITRYSTDNIIRQSLCNIAVLLVAVTVHVYAAPFIHADANLAELATLFSSILVLLVGLGSQQVAQLGGSHQMEADDSIDEAGVFYILNYTLIGLFIAATVFVILRRSCGVWVQYKSGSDKEVDDWIRDMLDKGEVSG